MCMYRIEVFDFPVCTVLYRKVPRFESKFFIVVTALCFRDGVASARRERGALCL